MENYQQTPNPQEPPVQQTHHPLQQYPVQHNQQNVRQYHLSQQHVQQYPMRQVQMPLMQMETPIVRQQMPQIQLPLSLIHPQEQVQLPSISSFASISPVAPESFKRKIESPVKKVNFPVAKIKAIMKADDEVAMISSDAVLAMSAATELFLQEFAEAAWKHTARDSRKTILYKDVAKAVESSIELEFLKDVSESLFKK